MGVVKFATSTYLIIRKTFCSNSTTRSGYFSVFQTIYNFFPHSPLALPSKKTNFHFRQTNVKKVEKAAF